MDFNKHTYDKIQRYLNNELSDGELRIFEAEIEEDKVLAAEVKLHEEMSIFLAETKENELRKNLQILSDQVDNRSDKAGGFSWKYLLIFLPVFIILWWLSNPNEAAVTSIPESVKKENPNNTPFQLLSDTISTAVREKDVPVKSADTIKLEKKIINKNVLKKTIKKNKIPPSIKKELPKSKLKEEPKDTLIYAENAVDSISNIEVAVVADFTPPIMIDASASTTTSADDLMSALTLSFQSNSELDFLIENNAKNENPKLTVNSLTQNFKIISENDAITFRLAGNIQSTIKLSKNTYKIYFFSNDVAAYQNFEPIQSSKFKINKIDNTTYSFYFKKVLKLSSGLYYILLRNKKTEEVLFVEKFVIEN